MVKKVIPIHSRLSGNLSYSLASKWQIIYAKNQATRGFIKVAIVSQFIQSSKGDKLYPIKLVPLIHTTVQK